MRILVTDNQPKLRQALCVLLEHQRGLEVVGEVADAAALLAQVKATHPDVVLLHWRLRGWTGTDPSLSSGQRSLCSVCEAHSALAVTMLSDGPEVEKATLAAGANAFVSNADPLERLLEAYVATERAGHSARANQGRLD